MRVAPRKTALSHVRLLVIVGLLIALVSLQFMNAQASRSSAPTGQRLRDVAGSFLIGYASRNNFWSGSDAAQYQEVARTEFNFLTPENAMKWDATEPSQNNFSFSQADQHVTFAQANNMKIHGHTLVWHSQLPSWVSSGSWTSATLTAVMNNHIDKVMNHWTDGTIYAWDVVNEAFEENGSRRASVFQNVIGNSYIDLAFQRARLADPTARLIYNDYNIETINSKSTAVYNMISDMKSRGIPIDGVGFQMHLTNGGLDYNSLAQNMQRFAALGLEIYITEMDVRFPTPVSQTDLQTQATIYSNVLARCRAQSACKALQVWGIPDKDSWVPSTFPGYGAPLIFDDNYNAKPAYYALQAQLGPGPTSTPTRTPVTPSVTTTGMSQTPLPTIPSRTFTPIPQLGHLKIQLSGSGTDNNQQTQFRFRVQNTGLDALSGISVRVYFATDGSNAASNYVLEKYYDQSGAATVSAPTLASGNTYYFAVNYGAVSLPAGGAWEYNTSLHLKNWDSSYNSTNDWWHSAGVLPASYADWTTVPVYLSGSRVWGNDPPVGPTLTPTGDLADLVPYSFTFYSYLLPTRTPPAQGCYLPGPDYGLGMQVTVRNLGTAATGSFIVDLNGQRQTVSGLAAGASVVVPFQKFSVPSNTVTVDATGLVAESNESNNIATWQVPAMTPTRTGTPPPTVCVSTVTPTGTATLLPPVIVEGHVRVGSSTGPGLPQVVITTWFGGPHGQVTTDADGYYQVIFPRPLNQETISLTPQLAGYTFSPSSYDWIMYARDTGPLTRDFIATSNGTLTPTFTPTATATIGPNTLRLQYRAADTNAGDNQIKPHFNIINVGTSAVPLSELKIRYWYTREGTANQTFWCDYAVPGCANLSGTFVAVSPARTGANFYLEISFTAAAGSLAAGGQSGEIQTRFAKTDWSNYTETGDYSFDPTKLSFADWTHVTLYRNGVLIWGTEP